jgi:SET domain-containing protein
MIEVRTTKRKGRGVYATERIAAGATIEVCELILFSWLQRRVIDQSERSKGLYNYYYSFGKDGAIALGNGSLYNHSYDPNARYKMDRKSKKIRFRALKDIKKGEEICVNYNGDPDDKSPLWFKVK